METSARYVLIGAFTVLGFFGLMAFVLWFANAKIDSSFTSYDVRFDSVSGISRGSEVRFAGVNVGQVVSLELAPDMSGKVQVRLEVSARTPVRTDSLATIETQGVTGVSHVAISTGNPANPLLRDTVAGVPILPAGRSMIQTLTEDAPELVDQAVEAIRRFNDLLSEENRAALGETLDNLHSASAKLDSALTSLDTAAGQIGEAVDAVAGFSDAVKGLSARAETTLDGADAAIAKVTALGDQAAVALDEGTATLRSARAVIDAEVKTALADVSATSTALRDATEALQPQASAFLSGWTETGAAATARLDEAEGLIASVKTTADAFDAETMDRLNTALARVAEDLPQITSDLRDAADRAEQTFAGIGDLVETARGPVGQFLTTGLPQLATLATEARGLVQTLQGTVNRLPTDPTRALLNSDVPEFRR